MCGKPAVPYTLFSKKFPVFEIPLRVGEPIFIVGECEVQHGSKDAKKFKFRVKE
jgi:hypothetical protein